MSETFEWEAEVFAVGRWNGMSFTREDLGEIAKAFSALAPNLQVPLKLGHDDDQPITDGEPAIGWVTGLRVEGDKLVAKFSDVPSVVFESVKRKRYRFPSIELLFDVTHKGTRYPLVMTGVALLGAELPAVNTLKDLGAFLSAQSNQPEGLQFTRRVCFSFKHEDISMTDETLKAELDKLRAERAELSAKLKTEEEARAKFQAEFEAKEKAEAQAKITTARKAVTDLLEQAVVSGRILPAQRGALFSLLKVDSDDAVTEIDLDQVEELIKGQERSDFGKGGAHQQDGQSSPTGKEASQEIVDLTYKYMADHGVEDFNKAMFSVMRANRDLAEEHAFSNGIKQ